MIIRRWSKRVVAFGCVAGVGYAQAQSADLLETFKNPPNAARPGVYWYFMDGNQDRDEMVAGLHAMKNVGIGSVLFLEVDLGIPRGPIPFMSESWQDNVAHAFVEAAKLYVEEDPGDKVPSFAEWSGDGMILDLNDNRIANLVRRFED